MALLEKQVIVEFTIVGHLRRAHPKLVDTSPDAETWNKPVVFQMNCTADANRLSSHFHAIRSAIEKKAEIYMKGTAEDCQGMGVGSEEYDDKKGMQKIDILGNVQPENN